MQEIFFSYEKNPEEGRQYFCHQINGTSHYLILKRTGIDSNSAILAQANQRGEVIPLLTGYTLTRQPSGIPALPILGLFVIEMGHSYVLSFDGRVVLNIDSQCRQQIKCQTSATGVMLLTQDGFVPSTVQEVERMVYFFKN